MKCFKIKKKENKENKEYLNKYKNKRNIFYYFY